MGCYVKPYKWGGWFTTEGSALLGRRLARRILNVIEGEKGLVLTLTTNMDRTAEETYDELGRNKAVSRFFLALQQRTGIDLKGKWLCKLEFNNKGYPHFHIVIRGVDFIPHHIVDECWGRGFVWLRSFKQNDYGRVSRYLSKGVADYVGKDLEIPAWLNERPLGSVKVIRTSPGFWGTPRKVVSDDEILAEESPDLDNGLPCFVPIGYKRVQSNLRVELSDDLSNRRVTFEGVNLGAVAVYLARNGHTFDYIDGQLHTTATFEDTLHAAACAARRSRPLHLNKVLNRAWVVEALASR